MKKTILLGVLAALCLLKTAAAQPDLTARPVKKGDKVPDLKFNHLVQYAAKNGKLSDFGDKLVILDFWASYCSPCIAAMPELESLQRKHGNKLQILLVSAESQAKVESTLKKYRVKLPSTYSDTAVNKFFPHAYIPFEVWLYRGEVVAVTNTGEVNEANILSVLEERSGSVKQRTDVLNFDGAKLLTENIPGIKAALYRYSLLAPAVPGLPANNRVERKNKTVYRKSLLNSSIMRLYKEAFGEGAAVFENENRVVYEVPDSLLVRVTGNGVKDKIAWLQQYGYCYEIIRPEGQSKALYRDMQQELNAFFSTAIGVTAKVENRKKSCYVIVHDHAFPLKTSGRTASNTSDSTGYSQINLPYKQFVSALQTINRKLPEPIIDQDNYDFNIDLELRGDLRDIGGLNKALAPYHLKLQRKEIMIPMLIFSHAKPSNPNQP